jgi:hypothetical protein
MPPKIGLANLRSALAMMPLSGLNGFSTLV